MKRQSGAARVPSGRNTERLSQSRKLEEHECAAARLVPVIEGVSLSVHYNATQLRLDAWNRLGGLAGMLDEPHPTKKEVEPVWDEIGELIGLLEPVELYWAFPGRQTFARLKKLFLKRTEDRFSRLATAIVRALVSETFRSQTVHLALLEQRMDSEADRRQQGSDKEIRKVGGRPYFEVLVVDALMPTAEQALRDSLEAMQCDDDCFTYSVVVVPSFEDALIAVLFNHNIQAVVVRYGFAYKSHNNLDLLQHYLGGIEGGKSKSSRALDRSVRLGEAIKTLRPELDLYLITGGATEEVACTATHIFRRIFYRQGDHFELHQNIQRGIGKRFETPFFTALKEYSKQPTGVFHALPISRGNSITKSHWIQDMLQFYGSNIFLAETSATSGGLDSLLYPSGPLKRAQELAARAFGSKQTYFVTNGTSTANKIVVQALVQPGDIVLVDRDCHKSHHYALVLAGANVCYLDPYPLTGYSICGAVPLERITAQLLEYQKAGLLDRVKMLILTNCTFDGVIYNVERVIEACLAIKPDLIFLWDEAWFAFARFHPTYRQRTAMHVAQQLSQRYRSAEYRDRYAVWKTAAGTGRDSCSAASGAMADPDRVRVRVYATQSTHKTLTSLRQGSMIHVHDQDFYGNVEHAFHEAYMTHTSTSPNYQILASLDVGRRQVELEGFELVQKQVELAMTLRERIKTHPLLRKWFTFLTMRDLIPPEYRESGLEVYYDPDRGWLRMEDAWATDEFALDPTRLTLFIGRTGISGEHFRTTVLMDKYGIHINKTSRNTVLLMTNIGTTRSSAAHLIEVLIRIAKELEEKFDNLSTHERGLYDKKIESLASSAIAVPPFSSFHSAFRNQTGANTPEGDMRKAYFLAYSNECCRYISLNDNSLENAAKHGERVVSAMFVTPYPPGFPILVPGQIVSSEIANFIRRLDVNEVHGYRADVGLRVFNESALCNDPSDGSRPG